MEQGVTLKHNKNGFAVMSIHYTAHPVKRNPEWIAKAKLGSNDAQWRQEMEMDSTATYGRRIYDCFNVGIHVKQAETPEKDGLWDVFQDNLKGKRQTIIVGWDFGTDYHACVFAWVSPLDQFCILKEFQLEKTNTYNFIPEMVKQRDLWFGSEVDYVEFCDIAGTFKTPNSTNTCVQIMNLHGIYPNYKKVNVEIGIDKTKKLMTQVNKYFCSNDCPILIGGDNGGYVRRATIEGTLTKNPRDNKYAHVQDARRYIIDNFYSEMLLSNKFVREEEEEDSNVFDRDTGTPIY